MKLRSLYYILTFMAVVLSVVLSGCRDDFDFRAGGISDEATVVNMSVDFTPASVGLTRAGYDGNSIRDVEDLCLVIFDMNDNFYDIKEIDVTKLTPEQKEEKPRDETATSNGQPTSEASTLRLTFPVELPIGTYYVYAVANLHQYEGETRKSKTSDYLESMMSETNLITRREFCELRRSWDTNSIKNNSELTGYVVNADNNGSSASPATDMWMVNGDYNLPGTPVTVVKGVNSLHCWLRRMASKVTVTFDAKDLSDNISVYIHDVQIHDAVKSAPLFTPGVATHSDSIMRDCVQYLAYCPEDHMNNTNDWKTLKDSWPKLTRSNWSFDQEDGHDDVADFDYLKDYTHSNSAKALFFYENMQGNGESKLQDAETKDDVGNITEYSPDGKVDSPDSGNPTDPDYKDKKPYGTYVEVRGYYVNRIRGEESEGPIVYRFMLGKNTIDNYDCERNYHYKLTLQLKGRANDVDWHIEYDRGEEEVYITSPYYISYGYNQSLDLPIKVKGKVTEVKATIIKNNWYPSQLWDSVVPPTWKDISDHIADAYRGNIDENSYPKVPKATALGFLTLYQPVSDAIGKTKGAGNENTQNPYLLDYWCGKEGVEDSRGTPLYTRTYLMPANQNEYDGESEGDKGEWSYVRTKTNGQDYTQIYVPLYTRERNLVKKLGYSGQNPFVAYQRRAKVLYEITVEGKTEPIRRIIDIVQVARVENPTGVWRNWNNSRPFHVALNLLDGEDNDTFTTLESRGGWSAEVIEGADWILINGGRQKIYGANGSKIEFDCRPVGVLTSPDKVRYGIVEVRYHDYSCVHKIFFRQGYAPVQVNSRGPYWHTMNMVTKDSEGVSPLDEGSMFRFGRWDDPIASSNNYNDKNPWIHVIPSSFKDHSTDLFTLANGAEAKTWNQIGSRAFTRNVTYMEEPNTITLQDGSVARMMEYKDIISLRNNNVNKDTAFAYGVLYGDEASSTLLNINEVYGYKGYLSHQQYGMRGCFVYNKNSGAQIFFPIGSSGYGKRQNTADNGGNWPEYVGERRAVLKYGGNGTYISHLRPTKSIYQYMKPLYSLFKSPGAMYWLYRAENHIDNAQDALEELDSDALGLDINYFSYDFNPAPGPDNLFTGAGTDANTSDAVFIRLVQDQPPTAN